MSKTKILTVLPYILIVLANGLYLFSRGLDQNLQWFQLFVYNFLIMVIAGIYIIFHINILLHKWLVQQSDKICQQQKQRRSTNSDANADVDKNENKKQKNRVSMKQVLRKKVEQLLELRYFITDCFNYGNQQFLVKIYLGIVVVKWVLSLFPAIFVGLVFFLYYQYKKPIDTRLSPLVKRAQSLYTKIKTKVLARVPRHSKVHYTEQNPIQQPSQQKQQIKDTTTQANTQQKNL